MWTSLPTAGKEGGLHDAYVAQHLPLVNVSAAMDLKNKKIANFKLTDDQKVLPEFENVAKTESKIATEGPRL